MADDLVGYYAGYVDQNPSAHPSDTVSLARAYLAVVAERDALLRQEADDRHSQENYERLEAQLAAMTAERDTFRAQLTASEAARGRMAEAKAGESTRDDRQRLMAKWCQNCFGPEAMSPAERGLRVGEEAAELAQAMGTPEDAFMRTVAAAYAKPVGDPAQEIGGVCTTLLAACAALDISADACERMEFARIHRPEIVAKAKARNERNKLDGTSVLPLAGKAGEP